MNSKNRNRAAAAGALVALLAAGAGVAAIGTGAIALGGSTGGAAIVTHLPGSRSVTFAPAELSRAAYQASYTQDVCTSDWLTGFSRCATDLQRCATQHVTSTVSIVATFSEAGTLLSCKAAS